MVQSNGGRLQMLTVTVSISECPPSFQPSTPVLSICSIHLMQHCFRSTYIFLRESFKYKLISKKKLPPNLEWILGEIIFAVKVWERAVA